MPGSSGERHMQRRLGTAARAERFYRDQVLDHLNPRMQEFLGQQGLMFVSSSAKDGSCDCSLRTGPAGFVRVLDDRTVAWPEYGGNGVMATLGNILENPQVGLLIVDFVDNVVGLHVNGHAQVVEVDQMRMQRGVEPDDSPAGRRSMVWVEVAVDEAYIHCSKRIPHLARREAGLGSEAVRRRGVDFFGASCTPSPWAPAPGGEEREAAS